jgi:lactate dehydrogenase-like 2-hydroxyacid dehydrogenase
MSTARILVTQVAHDLGREVFDSPPNGLSFEAAPEEEVPLAARMTERAAFGVVVAGVRYQGPLYASVPRGGIIARFGVGHDGINTELARQHGINLTNTPGVLDQSVAENAMFLLGCLARDIPRHNGAVHCGTWSVQRGVELRGTTLSIIGFGRIGKRVAQIAARGFGMKIVACDITPPDSHREFIEQLSAESGVEIRYTSSIPDAIRAGRFISLHMPIDQSTKGIIGAKELGMMPRGSFLINTARGALVDENALFGALESGHLAGAALDAFTNEPYSPVDPSRDLRKLLNVIMTPHISSSTRAAVRAIAEKCVENIQALQEKRFADMTTY